MLTIINTVVWDQTLIFKELYVPCNLELIGQLRTRDLEESDFSGGYNECMFLSKYN